MAAFILSFLGVALLGLAVGFLVAVSLGSKRADHPSGYRSWRDRSHSGPLERTARSIMGVTIRDNSTSGPHVVRDDDDDAQFPKPLTPA